MVVRTADNLSCSVPLTSAIHGMDLTWMLWKSPAQHQAGILLRNRGLKLQRFRIVLHLVSHGVLSCVAGTGLAIFHLNLAWGGQRAQNPAGSEAREMTHRTWGVS